MIGTLKAHARCATPLQPVEDVYGMTATLDDWNRSGSSCSGTYPRNSILGFPAFCCLTDST